MPDPAFPSDAERLIRETNALGCVLRVTEALLRSGRVVNLDGLQHSVGALSAQALQLDPPDRAALRPHLAQLLNDVDALAAVLRATAPPAA